jgi:integrase
MSCGRKSRRKLSVALSEEEVKVVFNSLSGSAWLMATLLYGSGPRLMEGIRSRVKDVDFAYNHIVVEDCKGDKDWVTALPLHVKAPLESHLQDAQKLHDQDLAERFEVSTWRTPWSENTRMPTRNGRGNTYFPPPAVLSTRAQLSKGGIM